MNIAWTCGHDSNVGPCPECGECFMDRCVCACGRKLSSEVLLTPKEVQMVAQGKPVFIKDSKGRSIKVIRM
jgi:hypothetical protein